VPRTSLFAASMSCALAALANAVRVSSAACFARSSDRSRAAHCCSAVLCGNRACGGWWSMHSLGLALASQLATLQPRLKRLCTSTLVHTAPHLRHGRLHVAQAELRPSRHQRGLRGVGQVQLAGHGCNLPQRAAPSGRQPLCWQPNRLKLLPQSVCCVAGGRYRQCMLLFTYVR